MWQNKERQGIVGGTNTDINGVDCREGIGGKGTIRGHWLSKGRCGTM